jgi:hypothetical protein
MLGDESRLGAPAFTIDKVLWVDEEEDSGEFDDLSDLEDDEFEDDFFDDDNFDGNGDYDDYDDAESEEAPEYTH